MVRGKTNTQRGTNQSGASRARLKRVEAKLNKKKDELLAVKALHRKIAGEFIDLWMETRRLKRKG